MPSGCVSGTIARSDPRFHGESSSADSLVRGPCADRAISGNHAPVTLRAEGPTLQVEVDARELRARLVHADIRIPCQPGPLRLWYPKWIPGCHAAEGPLQNVGGFRIETADGKPIRWKRDEVELFCVHCDVPAGVSEVRAHLDYICNEPAVLASGHLSYGNSSVGVLNWNTCLVYPEGPTAHETRVQLRLRLPERWQFATALKSTVKNDGGRLSACQSRGTRRLPAHRRRASRTIALEHDAKDVPACRLGIARCLAARPEGDLTCTHAS